MNQALKNIRNDVLKVGTMFVVTALLTGQSLTDPSWQNKVMNTLLGFMAYELVVVRLVNTDKFGKHKAMVNNLLKVATMLSVVRVLSGASLNDTQWLTASAFTLAGFATYDLITKKLVKTDGLSGNAKQIANDWVQVGTMLVVSHLLAGGDVSDARFLQSSVNQLVGFSAGSLVDRV